MDNPGSSRFAVALPGGSTASSPAIGLDNYIYVGTGSGLLAVSPVGKNVHTFTGYSIDESGACQPCTPPADGCTPVGSISSSAAITSDNRIVVGTDTGKVLYLRDENDQFTCYWVALLVDAPDSLLDARSSPLILADSQDDSVLAVIIGTGAGRLQALNGDGSERWSFSPETIAGPLSSSPVISSVGVLYISAPDGFLYAVDPAGRERWRFEIGTAASVLLPPSPSVNVAAYAVGRTGLLTAINPDGTLRWRYEAGTDILSSPAYTLQSINIPEPTPTSTPQPSVSPASTPTQPAAGTRTPTPTPTSPTETDRVVYVVDQDGTVHAIRDSTGMLEARLPLASGKVHTSPIITGDLFVLVGSDDGFLYATNLDEAEIPCEDCNETNWVAVPATQAWRVPLGSPVRSSPVIDEDGNIYITTQDGYLQVIGSPLPVEPTETPTPVQTATRTRRPTRTPR